MGQISPSTADLEMEDHRSSWRYWIALQHERHSYDYLWILLMRSANGLFENRRVLRKNLTRYRCPRHGENVKYDVHTLYTRTHVSTCCRELNLFEMDKNRRAHAVAIDPRTKWDESLIVLARPRFPSKKKRLCSIIFLKTMRMKTLRLEHRDFFLWNVYANARTGIIIDFCIRLDNVIVVLKLYFDGNVCRQPIFIRFGMQCVIAFSALMNTEIVGRDLFRIVTVRHYTRQTELSEPYVKKIVEIYFRTRRFFAPFTVVGRRLRKRRVPWNTSLQNRFGTTYRLASKPSSSGSFVIFSLSTTIIDRFLAVGERSWLMYTTTLLYSYAPLCLDNDTVNTWYIIIR